MPAVLADTHAAIWYLYGSPDLSAKALAALREAAHGGDPVYVASISLVEATYLVEKGRVPKLALERLAFGLFGEDRGFVAVPLDMAVARTVLQIPRELVPDMPDRIIAATALHLNLPLVRRDRRLQAANIQTIW